MASSRGGLGTGKGRVGRHEWVKGGEKLRKEELASGQRPCRLARRGLGFLGVA